jgi:RNA polymerase sigma-70 factor (ECF subfamily)
MVQATARVHPDDEDLSEQYRTHRARVVGLCYRLLGSPEQAEDAAHEVFLRAHAQRANFDAGRPFSSWVLTIASHYCIDVLRRRSTEARLFGTEEAEWVAASSDAPNPLGILLAQERQQELREAVLSLPPKYRIPLVLSVYREQSYDEIAAALGLSRSHVAILIFRARQQLRKALTSRVGWSGGRV